MENQARVKYAKVFIKQLKKAPQAIKIAFRERRVTYFNNPLDPQLRNHALKGKYIGLRSINITGDWRALYSERIEDGQKIIIFVLLGTHSQLYR